MKFKDIEGYKYQLDERVVVQTRILGYEASIPGFCSIHADGTIVAEIGYAWDGASGPTIDTLTLPENEHGWRFWKWLRPRSWRFWQWGRGCGWRMRRQSAVRASLVHDILYQLMRAGLLPQIVRPLADAELERLCIEDGFWRWRAGTWEWFVKKFAASAAAVEEEEKKAA